MIPRWICVPLLASAALAQTPRPSDWLSSGGDAQHTGWEKTDEQFSKSSVKDFKMVLRHKLGTGETLMAPLVVGRLISYKGFKELAIVGGSGGHVWALDADLDLVFWERQLPGGNDGPCGRVAMPAMMPAPDTGPARNASRPIFIVAGDGKLYRLNPATGEDVAPPLNFLPAKVNAASLSVADNMVYTSTDGSCGAPKMDWSMDVSSGVTGHLRLDSARDQTAWIDSTTGIRWVLHASVAAITAFRNDRQAWISRPMVSPQQPVIANGVVFTVAAAPSGNAVLHALDALTGVEIYSTGDQVAAPPAGTGLAIANGRVYFTTKDGTLWAFGPPMNRD